MKNCLLTKCKGIVNNDSLVALGVLRIKVTQETITNYDQQKLVVKGMGVKISTPGANNVATSIDGNGNLVNPQESITLANDLMTTLWFSNGNYNIEIDSKYELVHLYCTMSNSLTPIFKFDLSDLSYCKALTSLAPFKGTGSFEYIKDLTNLNTLYLIGPNFTGSIDDLGALTLLNNLQIYGGSSITGSIESFVAAQRSHERTETDTPINCDYLMCYIPFHGYTVSTTLRRINLSWTATKIIVYCGSQVGYQNATDIYEKGCTAEEIAAWQAAGKTVTDVVNGTVYPPTNA